MPKPTYVLIVDDDIAWLQILSEIVTEMGYLVDTAQSFEAAVAMLRARPYRLSIVDLSLGEFDHHNQDGLRVLEAARKRNPNGSTILISGFATVEVAVQAMKEFNAFTCLRKEEFKRAEFRKVIRDALAIALPIRDSVGEADGEPKGESQVTSKPSQEIRPLTEKALLVEDDAGWLELLRELLEDSGYDVTISNSYVDAIGHMKREKYSAAVIDLSLASSFHQEENKDGLRLLKHTKTHSIPTIVVSGYALPERIEEAYQNDEIFACLEKQSFERGFFRQALQEIKSSTANQNILAGLTRRELEVLELLVAGMTNKEIAGNLFVTNNTVKRHLKSVFSKLEVNTRAGAVSKAVLAGMKGS